MDEEEDGGSSWESEPEGEQAEELASLEAPGDDGDWCWPGRNSITRWGQRVDPRLAFHYLAEDDEEGELNHLVSRNAAEAQWTEWKNDSRTRRAH